MRILIGLASVLMTAVVLADTGSSAREEMPLRHFSVPPSWGEHVLAERAESGAAQGSDDEWASWKRLLADFGVEWPKGSSIKYVPSIGRLTVRNTPENLSRIEKALESLAVEPCQIETEFTLVSFDKGDVSALAASGITVDALTQLWKAGKATLVAAPRVITQSGVQATVKGVTECIYPTETSVTGLGTNGTNYASASVAAVLEPTNFEMREIGMILTVLPELSRDERMINLTMTPEYVEEPTWREYGLIVTDAGGKRHAVAMEQPFFHTYSMSTTVSLAPGARVLLGGGMPSRDGTRITYAFVTANKVGIRGASAAD